jgi:universal stress protein E
MNASTNISKVLVVISPDLIRPDDPLDSILLRRAIDLAVHTGCELELFHVCYDSLLDYHLFDFGDDLQRRREVVTAPEATVLADIARRVAEMGVTVTHETRWDRPRTEAILRKAAQARPDVVMKQAREHSFVLGLGSNTDWELVRRSPANVWLVDDSRKRIHCILAAVGNDSDAEDGEFDDLARANFRTAGLIANALGAEVHAVNACHNPGYQYDRMADHFPTDRNHLNIARGHPSDVIPQVADALSADMIVMGARPVSRFERLLRPVTVEPVLANVSCDVLVIRQPDASSMFVSAEPEAHQFASRDTGPASNAAI